MNIMEEIQFAEKLLEIDEPKRALTFCEYLLSQLSEKSDADSIIRIRELLISSVFCLVWNENDRFEWREYVNTQYDRLFENYLMFGDKKGAADTLLRKAEYNKGEREGVYAGAKLLDLFGDSADPDVRETVELLLSTSLDGVIARDPRYLHEVTRYLQFLSRGEDAKRYIDEFFIESADAHFPSDRPEHYLRLIGEFLLPLGEPSEGVKWYMASAYAGAGDIEKAIRMRFDMMLEGREDAIDQDQVIQLADWCEDIGAKGLARVFRLAAAKPSVDDDPPQ